jgi:acetyl esterase/lipase
MLAGLLLCGLLTNSYASWEQSAISIWPEGTELINASVPESVFNKKPGLITNIHNPSLTLFRPEKPNGTAVVICPGGAYRIVAFDHEGKQVAEKLNQSGITAFVLKYRLPTTEGVDFKHPVPLADALRAVQWVRFNSSEYKLDPKRIGIMGFSAGGHLSASAATLWSKYRFGDDEISEVSSRPDFACLGYPVITADKAHAHGCVSHSLKEGYTPEQLREMSCELNVSDETPPTFLFHAKDDKGVVPQNSVLMHEALKKNGVATELKLYEKGGHGFGLGRKGTDSVQWPDDFIAWLKGLEIIPLERDFFTPKQDLDGLKSHSAWQADLPNVLIVGDSISIGYTKPVVEQLEGVVNVRRVKTNCGDTARGLANIEKWLGDTKWDVIHFNWGLHDLCYRHPDSKVYGNRDKVNGTIAVPLDQYKKNLETLVLQLKKSGAKLIWASTTVVPEGEAGRRVGDEVRYNAVAEKIMKKHGVSINDLHALSATFPPELFARPGDVHYTAGGSRKLAEQVAGSVKGCLIQREINE